MKVLVRDADGHPLGELDLAREGFAASFFGDNPWMPFRDTLVVVLACEDDSEQNLLNTDPAVGIGG